MPGSDNRGQAYTIEGIIGAIVIASALVLGLQAVDTAPWTDDSTDRQTESLRVQVQDVLDAAEDRDALRTAATCIDGDGNGTPHPAVAAGSADSDTARATFGTLLNRTLDRNNQRYSVYLDYQNATDPSDINTTALTPDRDVTGSSVTATHQVALFDTDPIMEFDTDAGGCLERPPGLNRNNTLKQRDIENDRDVYVEDQYGESELYAVVKIRVVTW
jgi:hypothetical protein